MEISSEELKQPLLKNKDFQTSIHFVKTSFSAAAKSKRRRSGLMDNLCEEENEELEEDLDEGHILYRTDFTSNKGELETSHNSYRSHRFNEVYISPLLRPPRS